MLTSLKFLFLIVVTLYSVAAVEIHCKYSSFSYFTVGRAYTCAVEQKRDALWADSEVIKIAGDHSDKNKDSNVIAVRVHTRVMHTFPSNFEKFFQNLKVIQVYASKLKIITQKDLQPFVKLQHVDLSRNDLESLEKELFKFNTELLVIKISENKLKYIDATAFDTLFKIHTLELNDNQCIWKSTESRDNWDEEDELTREEVIDVMFEARTRCYRDVILKELHEMEMGKFLKERSEIVVNLETKIGELQEENENFYRKMQQFKDELDVCKMDEIRKSGVMGSDKMMIGDVGMRKNGEVHSSGHRGQIGITRGNSNLNGRNFNANSNNKSGPNSYLPLNRDQPPKNGIPLISLIDDAPRKPQNGYSEKSKNNFDDSRSNYLPKSEIHSLQAPYENDFNREQRFDGRNNRVDYERPQEQPAYMYRSQQQNYGKQWENWGKRQNEERSWNRNYY